jgi:hypothetical protein
MTGSYIITVNGTEMGAYEGEASYYAILAYVRDAGYPTIAYAADACGQSVEEFLADINVTGAA